MNYGSQDRSARLIGRFGKALASVHCVLVSALFARETETLSSVEHWTTNVRASSRSGDLMHRRRARWAVVAHRQGLDQDMQLPI